MYLFLRSSDTDKSSTSQAHTKVDTIDAFVETVPIGARVFARVNEVQPFVGATVTLVATGERVPRDLSHLAMRIDVDKDNMSRVDKAMTNHVFLCEFSNRNSSSHRLISAINSV